jgi:hypothetical protein
MCEFKRAKRGGRRRRRSKNNDGAIIVFYWNQPIVGLIDQHSNLQVCSTWPWPLVESEQLK